MENEQPNKRARSANYTEKEKQLLFSLVFMNKNIIENKKTDSVSTQEKKCAWEKIAAQFNSSSPGLIHRPPDSLRKFYENRKKDIRKDMAKERCELYRTGGGPPVQKKHENDILLSVINQKSIFGMENPICDGDTLQTTKNNTNPETSTIKSTKRPCVESISSISGITEPKIAKICHNDVVFELQREDIDAENGGSELENIEFVVEEPAVKNATPRKNPEQLGYNSRRRPATVVKALTSSNIAEKYDQLLEKRLLLCNYKIGKIKKNVENDDKEHKLRLEALSLDIKIKKKQLQEI